MQQQRAFTLRLAEFVLAKRHHASILAVIFAVIPLLAWVSAVIVSLVTLRKGWAAGVFVLAWALLPDVAMLFSDAVPRQLVVMDMLVGFCLPLVFCSVLRVSHSWQQLIAFAVLVGMTVLVILSVMLPDYPHQVVLRVIDSYHALEQQGGWFTAKPEMLEALQHMSGLVFGVQLLIGLLSALTTVLIARGVQARLFCPGGLREALLQFRAYRIYALGFVLAAVAAVLQFDSAYSILLLVSLPLFAAGTSLVHYVAELSRRPTRLQVVYYLIVILFIPFSCLAVSVLGLVDSFIDCRQFCRHSLKTDVMKD